jgi:hypothetical protein
MKLNFLFIVLIPFLTLSACSGKKTANALASAFGPVTPSPSSPTGQPDQPAVGKINNKEFKPVAATLITNLFDEQNAEIVLTEEPVFDCWPHQDRYISVPLLKKSNLYGDYTPNSGDWMIVLFYAHENGMDYNGNVTDSNISWSVKNEDGKDMAYFNIEDSTKTNQLIGKIPLQNCL